ncbi:hypothetical protein A2422_00590 [Candidatus Woesebacteria bacterium RIFOXYC1_FULL_31_51]|uniref:Beta-lactamase class A-like protein n=1 Tax=Candidatus Woesebacteria bacterium GW2011_GWC2_31_9 TaxID=1618586 RepID=A0A0F9YKC2_9BACT|nr:MAG: peptidoglycan-binding protein [Candidatus Woesebacteria bacterium GW2011_GWF1_31_35]KKP23146.1 MAG: beta-lactamase class A-like protein [Candidatus Woesebacteria bacterium GW2011_GWC1_30_29]KKP26834.1 MAG: beta-lactamase class A-like protein [Candidatus Woesebacteria bacterium GW2011_GWD1_31_12]KKP27409.1 MAG: beta-lactamase class A-like protein [Candidatus Woesebacteria bacterium GW2011_GWB1_31_29]KKP31708.1 MAG: beta-lactamase class A-like protein [Candidatus Woesebacteria bacterium G
MIFSRGKDADFEDEVEEEEIPKRKFRDLRPENRRARKEPPKPWGKKERLIVLIILLVTVLTSGILALTARNFKLPNFPKIGIPNLSNFNIFKEQVIIVGNKGTKVNLAKIENTKKQFKSLTDDYSGIYAFYIYDLNGNYFYGENYQEKMQAASLIKLPVIYLTYLESQKGNLDINEYRSYLEAMGKRSDNQAFIKMVSILGKENINKAIINLGMSKTSLEENITTPEDIGLFFKKLKNYEILNKENTDEFLEFLTDTSFEKWLRPGIPSEIRLAHKYGREVHAVNDAGIVFSDKPFVLVIMTDGVVESEADKIFPELSKLLYNDQINEKTN